VQAPSTIITNSSFSPWTAQQPLPASTGFNAPLTQIPNSYAQYTQPAGGFGGVGRLYASPPSAAASSFYFPDIINSYSNQIPTIGKTFHQPSTSSIKIANPNVSSTSNTSGTSAVCSPSLCTPVDCDPVDCEPVDCEPVDCEPVDCEPVDCEPVECPYPKLKDAEVPKRRIQFFTQYLQIDYSNLATQSKKY
jgi:hypothetical protein